MEYLDKKQSDTRKILDLELLGFKDFRVVGYYKYTSVKQRLEAHTHSGMFEIIYLKKGFQYYQIADRKYMLKGGDVLLVPPDMPHGTDSYPEDIGSLYWAVFRIPENKTGLLNLSVAETHYIVSRLLDVGARHFEGGKVVASLFPSLYSYFDLTEKTKSKIRLTSLLLQLLLEILNATEKDMFGNRISKKIREILDYIGEHLLDELSIDQLADHCHLSVSRFKHRFKKEIGIPPGEYLVRQKIEYAKLHYHNYQSIQSLAFALGFSSSNYFASVFKKYTGSTPSQYFYRV